MKRHDNIMKDFKSKILAWAIAIVLVIFVSVGISTFYPSPDYEECYRPAPCVVGDEECNKQFDEVVKKEIEECQDKNDAIMESYSRVVFIVYLIAGFLALIIGLVLKSNKIVSFGFGVGGVANMIIGFLFYWRYLGDYVRFVAVGILLVLLIWFAYKKMR